MISILVGLIFLVIFSLLLWVMLIRPSQWARFTEKEHEFWVKRGMPVKWAGANRALNRSWVMKVYVGLTILVAVLLTSSPFIVLLIAAHRR